MTKPLYAALFRFLFLRVFKHQPKGKSGQTAKARIKQINDFRTGTDGYLYGFYHLKPPFLIFSHGKRIINLLKKGLAWKGSRITTSLLQKSRCSGE